VARSGVRLPIRRNLLAVTLAVTGLTLFGLAAIDWQDYLWTIVYHVQVR